MTLLLWLVGTILMYVLHPLAYILVIPPGVLLGLYWGIVSRRRTRALAQAYRDRWGEEPGLLTSDIDTARTQRGGAMGALMGHYALGAALGATVDLVKHARKRTTWRPRSICAHRS